MCWLGGLLDAHAKSAGDRADRAGCAAGGLMLVHDDVTAGNEREVETMAECVMGGESKGGTMVSSSSSSGTDHHVTHVATGEREEDDGEPKRRQAM